MPTSTAQFRLYVDVVLRGGFLRGGSDVDGAGAATGAGAGAGVAAGAGHGASGVGAGACGSVSAGEAAGGLGSPSALSLVTFVTLELMAMITGFPPKAPDAELTPPLATMTFGGAVFSDRFSALFRRKHVLSAAVTSRFFSSSYFFRPAPQVRGSFTRVSFPVRVRVQMFKTWRVLY